MPAHNVAILVGSLRRDSLNRKMAQALARLMPERLRLEDVPIRDLPPYDPDLDGSPPQPWTDLRDRIRAADAVLFVTPEYNRSVPGVLKNAIDVASRPYGKSAFDGKPGAVMSVSPGAIGGFGANHHLRQMLVFLNVPVLQQPEAYVGGAGKLFDEHGGITVDATREFLTKFMTAFAEHVGRYAKRAG